MLRLLEVIIGDEFNRGRVGTVWMRGREWREEEKRVEVVVVVEVDERVGKGLCRLRPRLEKGRGDTFSDWRLVLV